MYCKNCGNKCNEGEKYCTVCGNPIESNIQNTNNSKNQNDYPIIFGILACILFAVPLVSVPLAIISIVTGINQRKEEKNATIGIILGIISILLSIIIIIGIILLVTFAVNKVDNVIDDFQINDILDEYRNQEIIDNFDIKGHSWKADDNSMLYLNNDNTYIWYQNDQDHEDNYYEGKFKEYNGKEAIQYIATYLKEYGITEEEQEKIFEKGSLQLNNYYLLVLTCEKSKMNGKEEGQTDNIAYYYGFYSKTNSRLDLTNITTKKKVGFTLNKKLEDIDI